jgi:hypothetical protein
MSKNINFKFLSEKDYVTICVSEESIGSADIAAAASDDDEDDDDDDDDDDEIEECG